MRRADVFNAIGLAGMLSVYATYVVLRYWSERRRGREATIARIILNGASRERLMAQEQMTNADA